jgi:hypothetical protein
VRITRQLDGAALLYEVLPRIHRFSLAFEGDPIGLTDQVMALYLKGSPELGLWVAAENGRIVGHLLAMISQWDGQPVAWVNQAEMDQGHSHPDFIKAQTDALDAWVHEVNAWYAQHQVPIVIREQMMQTPWIDRSEAWARGFGFKPHRLLCRREVRR